MTKLGNTFAMSVFFKGVCGIYKEMLRADIERLQREHDANPAQPATLKTTP